MFNSLPKYPAFPKKKSKNYNSFPLKKLPPFEKLVGDLAGAYSRRINTQHCLIYQIIIEKRTVKIIRMWSHYE
ncbi:MAG: Txe/YoeB family addiction module toxin [Candidatus Aminicenantes bacterium]|nr:MAG: Txe/YoeB family addiction module toxin [Candidatus Aminicenantes bacterium]